MRLRKRAFGNTVMLCCGRFLYELIESDDDKVRKKVQETINNHCFELIRKRGPKKISDFKKMLTETVLQIVTSDDPIMSMRKELISEIHLDTINRSFFLEKYRNQRQELYDIFDKY